MSAAARRVHDHDLGPGALERLDRPPGERLRLLMQAAVGVEGAAAALVPRHHHVAGVLREHGRSRAVHPAEHHLLHAAGEHRHARPAPTLGRDQRGQRRALRRRPERRQQRLPRGERAGQEPKEPARPGQTLEPAHLIRAQARGHEREHSRMTQEQPEVDPAERAPHRAPGTLALDLGTGGFDEPAVRYSGRADGLARPAVETEREVPDRRIREADPALGQRFDQQDPPPRRIHLGAQLREGRAVRKAEPAVHALIHALDREAVELERNRGRRRGRVYRRHQIPPT
jgi:hypothetical protein